MSNEKVPGLQSPGEEHVTKATGEFTRYEPANRTEVRISRTGPQPAGVLAELAELPPDEFREMAARVEVPPPPELVRKPFPFVGADVYFAEPCRTREGVFVLRTAKVVEVHGDEAAVDLLYATPDGWRGKRGVRYADSFTPGRWSWSPWSIETPPRFIEEPAGG